MIVGCLALLLVCLPALAAASSFPQRLSLEQDTLVRMGQGTAHYARIIPVYDIALYAQPALPANELLNPEVARRLEIVYRVAIKAADLERAAEKILTRQHPQERLARWRAQLDALHRSYRDVEPGDRYTLSYLPRQGLWLEFNGERVIALQGEDFAAAYFGIWLGDEPLSESLRQQLVSDAATTQVQ